MVEMMSPPKAAAACSTTLIFGLISLSKSFTILGTPVEADEEAEAEAEAETVAPPAYAPSSLLTRDSNLLRSCSNLDSISFVLFACL